jgi:hypothetical protein
MGDALRNLRCQSLRYAAVSGAATMARCVGAALRRLNAIMAAISSETIDC